MGWALATENRGLDDSLDIALISSFLFRKLSVFYDRERIFLLEDLMNMQGMNGICGNVWYSCRVVCSIIPFLAHDNQGCHLFLFKNYLPSSK